MDTEQPTFCSVYEPRYLNAVELFVQCLVTRRYRVTRVRIMSVELACAGTPDVMNRPVHPGDAVGPRTRHK